MQRSDQREVEASPRKKRMLHSGKFRLAIASAFAVLAIGGGTYYLLSNQPLIEKSVISKASFSVYAPKQEPEGYKLQKEQTKLSDSTLTYSLVNEAADKTITVTVQPRPAGFDMSQMTKGGSINSTTTSNGTLYNLSAAGMSKYLLDTGDSLVFFTSSVAIDTATMNELASDLIKLN